MFVEFLKDGGVAIADQLNLNRARALERYDKNYKISDIKELTIDGQANETWLRKNGLLYSVGGRYELSPLANAIIRDKISLADYCFLLLSKQWIKVKKLGGKDEYKANLLSIILADFISCRSIPVNVFVSHVGQKALDLFKEEYSGLVLSNKEAARYLIEPLLISKLIKEEQGNYILNPEMQELAADYVQNSAFIKRIDQVTCADEEYWSSFQYGFYDIVNNENKHLYVRHYPHLFAMKELYKENGSLPLQQIFYGAPGTGKSNEIKRLTGDGTFSKNLTFRTTFHPDSDYSSFVGAYKPIWKDDKIVYDFRPQTFLKAYVAAWTHPTKEVALVIEEINRGNCAQVFGDIFQLLDREKNGLSKYPIEADMDMKDFLKRAFNSGVSEPWVGTFSEDNRDEIDEYYVTHYDNAFEKIKNGEILALPKNLSLLATMNTSDQSLFPMDSAFKRRWDWSYQPIVDKQKGWKIKIGEKYEPIDWGEFLQRINKVIADLTTSEDKQLGYYFCMPDEKDVPADNELKVISAKTFVGKVIFYLWNDVFKDYAFDAKCCKGEDEKEILFAKFYNEDGKSVNIDVLKHFFETLKDDTQESLVKIKPANTDSAVSNGETIEEPEIQDTTTAEE